MASISLIYVLKIEIHILWAQHQVHHSSEDYNLAVGLRQSIFHTWCGVVSLFYIFICSRIRADYLKKERRKSNKKNSAQLLLLQSL